MLSFRKAQIEDVKLYFDWANDPIVRKQSYQSNSIDYATHSKWFENKIQDSCCLMLIFKNDSNEIIGQLRIQKQSDNNAIIGISIDSKHRGKGYAKEILQMGSNYFLLNNPNFIIHAYIKNENLVSKYAFEKADFEFQNMLNYKNFNSFHYIKTHHDN